MNKKVVIVSSSPRKNGNSELLCKELEKGALQSGNTVEYVILRDKNIGYCTGCGQCFNNHKCSQSDDMEEILNILIHADTIVLATPVYFYSMCAQLKTFIDRCCAKYQEISNKEFYFIVTAADGNKENMKRTIEALRGFTEDCLPNANEKGIIHGMSAWNIGDIEGSVAIREAYETGKNI